MLSAAQSKTVDCGLRIADPGDFGILDKADENLRFHPTCNLRFTGVA
jgi:hypothetical protein